MFKKIIHNEKQNNCEILTVKIQQISWIIYFI